MANSPDHELEAKIWEMSIYLDRLVTGEEKDYRSDPECASCSGIASTDLKRRTPPLPYIPRLPVPGNPMTPHLSMSPILMAPPNYPLTSVTSALASRMNANSSTLRFVNPAPHPRPRKWGNHKQTEKEPNTSDIDINATMAELGLTPESLTNNEVYRLFSTYNKLAFYIHADYIFENIYEGRTLPNTMSASVQTRHAIWSSNRLLRQLRDTLKKHAHVPFEYQHPLTECKQSLEDLCAAIMELETYKYCVLEHRKGKFISVEAKENLEPLMNALNQVIECVGKSRMYVQVINWALNRGRQSIAAAVENGHEGPSQPIAEDVSLESSTQGRPVMARRFIG